MKDKCAVAKHKSHSAFIFQNILEPLKDKPACRTN